jgi:hypothetical protein
MSQQKWTVHVRSDVCFQEQKSGRLINTTGILGKTLVLSIKEDGSIAYTMHRSNDGGLGRQMESNETSPRETDEQHSSENCFLLIACFNS